MTRPHIHDGQERKRSVHGPDTEAQDLSPPIIIFGLQRAAGPVRLKDEHKISGLPLKADIDW
jgi:hypothetical protein